MPVRLNPYLGFRTTARDALNFYQSVFGGDLSIMTFGEGGMSENAEDADLVMHGQLDTPNGLTLMASDTPPSMPASETGSSISISLSGDDEPTLRGYWDKLLEGGTATMPLDKAPWGDIFGMLTDRHGTNWMIDIGPQQ